MRMGQAQPMGWGPSVSQQLHGRAGAGMQRRRRDVLRGFLMQGISLMLAVRWDVSTAASAPCCMQE